MNVISANTKLSFASSLDCVGRSSKALVLSLLVMLDRGLLVGIGEGELKFLRFTQILVCLLISEAVSLKEEKSLLEIVASVLGDDGLIFAFVTWSLS
jgi:hypothetical protein